MLYDRRKYANRACPWNLLARHNIFYGRLGWVQSDVESNCDESPYK